MVRGKTAHFPRKHPPPSLLPTDAAEATQPFCSRASGDWAVCIPVFLQIAFMYNNNFFHTKNFLARPLYCKLQHRVHNVSNAAISKHYQPCQSRKKCHFLLSIHMEGSLCYHELVHFTEFSFLFFFLFLDQLRKSKPAYVSAHTSVIRMETTCCLLFGE